MILIFLSHYFHFSINLRIKDGDSKVFLLTTGKHMLREELKNIHLLLRITACLFQLKPAFICQCARGIGVGSLAKGK